MEIHISTNPTGKVKDHGETQSDDSQIIKEGNDIKTM